LLFAYASRTQNQPTNKTPSNNSNVSGNAPQIALRILEKLPSDDTCVFL
jgi:hypothetical protein